ncbi:hypothetical protein RHS03_08096, partial [Rhizoctonia solani]
MSTTFSSSSRASSLPPSQPTRELKETPTMTWTTAMFSFPPCDSHPPRAVIATSKEHPKSCETWVSFPSSANTSRVINHVPGFDDFVQLVTSNSERIAPKHTTNLNMHSFPRISTARRIQSHSSKSLRPNPAWPVSQAQTTSLASSGWSKDDSDTGCVTFVFGRSKPSVG